MYSPLLISSIISLILLLYPVAPAVAEESDQAGYSTPYETIYYYQEDTSAPSVPQKHDEKSLSLSKETVNSMVYRVKTILGMYTQDLNFGIRIYRTHDELKEFFRSMGLKGDVPVAFYSHKDKTIYLSDENLTDRILVHEIAHAVMNAYFIPLPPRNVQEILAHYVERQYLY